MNIVIYRVPQPGDDRDDEKFNQPIASENLKIYDPIGNPEIVSAFVVLDDRQYRIFVQPGTLTLDDDELARAIMAIQLDQNLDKNDQTERLFDLFKAQWQARSKR